jgi:hypothetical protein
MLPILDCPECGLPAVMQGSINISDGAGKFATVIMLECISHKHMPKLSVTEYERLSRPLTDED